VGSLRARGRTKEVEGVNGAGIDSKCLRRREAKHELGSAIRCDETG